MRQFFIYGLKFIPSWSKYLTKNYPQFTTCTIFLSLPFMHRYSSSNLNHSSHLVKESKSRANFNRYINLVNNLALKEGIKSNDFQLDDNFRSINENKKHFCKNTFQSIIKLGFCLFKLVENSLIVIRIDKSL